MGDWPPDHLIFYSKHVFTMRECQNTRTAVMRNWEDMKPTEISIFKNATFNNLWTG